MSSRNGSINSREVKIGERFGRWTVVGEPYFETWACGVRHRAIPCRCDCGTERAVNARCLFQGRSPSCGCMSAERIGSSRRRHSESGSRLYLVWQGMKRRCGDSNERAYPNYGGRGIRVCPEWHGSYEAFRDWALANGYRRGLTIERKDNDAGYSPENCAWADRCTQCNNKRTSLIVEAFGERKTVAQWVRDSRCIVKYMTLYTRVAQHGWQPEAALSTPAGRGRLSAEQAKKVRL